MKKSFYLLPVLLVLFAGCSSDDDLQDPDPEAENSVFKVEYSQAGDVGHFYQDITLYGSPVGWEDTDTGAEIDPYLNSEIEELPGSFSYETKQSTPAIWVTYNVTPHNVEGEISLGVTFKFYQDGKLIDTKDLSIDNESTVTDSFEWKYFSDTGDE